MNIDVARARRPATKKLTSGKSARYGPKEADVTGDGFMEIIACAYDGIYIIDRNFEILESITGFRETLTNAVAQDINGDGLAEVVVTRLRFGGEYGQTFAYDTKVNSLYFNVIRARVLDDFYIVLKIRAHAHTSFIAPSNTRKVVNLKRIWKFLIKWNEPTIIKINDVIFIQNREGY